MAGALSALGMLLADRVRDYSASALHCGDIEKLYRKLERSANGDMPGCRMERSADVRYSGQSYELNVPWRPPDSARVFHREHHKIYGYSDPGRAVEVVTVRLKASLSVSKPSIRRDRLSTPATEQKRKVRIGSKWLHVPVHHLTGLSSRRRLGPALALHLGSSTLIPPRW